MNTPTTPSPEAQYAAAEIVTRLPALLADSPLNSSGVIAGIIWNAMLESYRKAPITCAYCGHESSKDDPKAITDHILSCEKNPLVETIKKADAMLALLGEQLVDVMDNGHRDWMGSSHEPGEDDSCAVCRLQKFLNTTDPQHVGSEGLKRITQLRAEVTAANEKLRAERDRADATLQNLEKLWQTFVMLKRDLDDPAGIHVPMYGIPKTAWLEAVNRCAEIYPERCS